MRDIKVTVDVHLQLVKKKYNILNKNIQNFFFFLDFKYEKLTKQDEQ